MEQAAGRSREEINYEMHEAERMVAIALANLYLVRFTQAEGRLPSLTTYCCYPEEMLPSDATNMLEDKRIRVRLDIQNRHEDTD